MVMRDICTVGKQGRSASGVALATLVAVLAAPAAHSQTRPALVKDVDSPAAQPFAASLPTTSFSGLTVTGTFMTVPAGKRAVVEHVSCIDYIGSTDNWIRIELRYTVGGVQRRHQFVHTRVGTSFLSGVDVWSFSQPIRAYADASTQIQMVAFRRTGTGSGGIECEISGHYVDAP